MSFSLDCFFMYLPFYLQLISFNLNLITILIFLNFFFDIVMTIFLKYSRSLSLSLSQHYLFLHIRIIKNKKKSICFNIRFFSLFICLIGQNPKIQCFFVSLHLLAYISSSRKLFTYLSHCQIKG